MASLTKNNNNYKVEIILKPVILLYISSLLILSVNCSRADLGSYLHIKEIPGSEEKLSIDSYVLAFINYTYITPEGREVHFSEEKARYGEGKILNVQGILVHVTADSDVLDHTACNPAIRGTGGSPLPVGRTWIALVRRGICTFDEKIKNVYRYKAAGVIVYNEQSSATLEKMKIIDKERNITAVFTYKMIGEALARIVEDGTPVWVSISEGQRGVRPLGNINKTSVLFVSISFIVLMIISLIWLIFYYVQRFRYLQSKDQHSRHLCTVAKRIIMKIPTKSGKSDDKDSENDCCAICIEPYKSTDCIRVLPCKHEYHKNCIDPWLLEHRTCPMCKLDVLKYYGFVFLGSEESILQLDLDAEIMEGGLHSSEDDRLSFDNIRINTTPTFHIQAFERNNAGSSLRRSDSSTDSLSIIHRDDLPERSQSSLSRINHLLEETIGNRLFLNNFCSNNNNNNNNSNLINNNSSMVHQQQQQQPQQFNHRHHHQQQQLNQSPSDLCCGTVAAKDFRNNQKSSDSKFLHPNDVRKDIESISLPGTLKKLRSSQNCRGGSNNCYIKVAPLDLKQLATKIEKGCPKSRTTIMRQESDDQYLLPNEKTPEMADDDDAVVTITTTASTVNNTATITTEGGDPGLSDPAQVPEIRIQIGDNKNRKYEGDIGKL